MRYCAAIFDDIRNDIFTEVMTRIWICCIASQLIKEKVGVKDVYTHAGKGLVGFPGHRRRIVGLLKEGLDNVIFVYMDDSESAGFRSRHFETPDSDICTHIDMPLHGFLVFGVAVTDATNSAIKDRD